MRTAYFLTPKHYGKVCDIAAEAVVQLYTNSKELYYSDIFSYIMDDILYVKGWVSSNTHFSIDEIKEFILKCIEIEIPVVLSIQQKELLENIQIFGSGTFLGYSTNENKQGIPFEQLEVENLTKFLYSVVDAAMRVQITVNGQQIEVCVETDYTNHQQIKDLINEYLNGKGYMQRIIKIDTIDKNIVYKSDDNFISNTYGPRVMYGNTKFIGLDTNRNSKLTHLVSKEIADRYIININLNYSLIELTYSSNNETPIQFGIKGNRGGINIENGTFFEYSSDYTRILNTKIAILHKIKSNPMALVEMAKWGYFNYK